MAVAATTAFVSAGCDTQPDSPDAVSWANSVCEALLPWMDEIDTLTGAASVAMTPDSSPGEAKNELLELLSGAADASREARDAVIAAGVPDVDRRSPPGSPIRWRVLVTPISPRTTTWPR